MANPTRTFSLRSYKKPPIPPIRYPNRMTSREYEEYCENYEIKVKAWVRDDLRSLEEKPREHTCPGYCEPCLDGEIHVAQLEGPEKHDSTIRPRSGFGSDFATAIPEKLLAEYEAEDKGRYCSCDPQPKEELTCYPPKCPQCRKFKYGWGEDPGGPPWNQRSS